LHYYGRTHVLQYFESALVEEVLGPLPFAQAILPHFPYRLHVLNQKLEQNVLGEPKEIVLGRISHNGFVATDLFDEFTLEQRNTQVFFSLALVDCKYLVKDFSTYVQNTVTSQS